MFPLKTWLRYKLGRYGTTSFSQEGEDLVLVEIFSNLRSGFYVDVGAHHPYRFSNTFLLYQMGWSGINIEPNPNVATLFKWLRPRDLHLSSAVFRTRGTRLYHFYDEPALNTFNKEVIDFLKDNDGTPVIGRKGIEGLPLCDILERHAPANQQVEILNVDVEGAELEVLESNDFLRFRPKVILVECISKRKGSDGIEAFLLSKGYEAGHVSGRTRFFLDQEACKSLPKSLAHS